MSSFSAAALALLLLAVRAAAAEPDFNAPGYWTKAYGFPSHYLTALVELRPDAVGAARTKVAELMAEAGGAPASGQNINALRQSETVRVDAGGGQVSYTSRYKTDEPGDSNELWEVPGASAPALAQRILGLGVILQFQQNDQSRQIPVADIEALYFKRDGLRREMEALGAKLGDMPGIEGLLGAQMKNLEQFIKAHEAAKSRALIRVALRAK
ncbi:hypothetical protein EPO15_08625 [bacterium]|nr:MAG: hypothetical protein EPO15_08625 [bacterium]